MKKEKIIKESKKFTEIINNNNSVKNKYFSIYYEKSDINKYGITIPKKIAKANVRNRIKRRIKNIITTNEISIQNNFNYVIIVKKAILDLNYRNMEQELLNLIKKVGK